MGNATRMCQVNGEWSGGTPACGELQHMYKNNIIRNRLLKCFDNILVPVFKLCENTNYQTEVKPCIHYHIY